MVVDHGQTFSPANPSRENHLTDCPESCNSRKSEDRAAACQILQKFCPLHVFRCSFIANIFQRLHPLHAGRPRGKLDSQGQGVIWPAVLPSWWGGAMRGQPQSQDFPAWSPYSHSYGTPLSPRINLTSSPKPASERTSFERISTQRWLASKQTIVLAVCPSCPPL